MDASTKTLVLTPWEGQTLKHYRIDGLIGAGGMGVVYRAHDLKLQRPVAIKVLPAELTADADRRKRFLLEARTAARISHPAIAQVYDVDEHEGTIFIAMELVEGKTIRDLIQGRQLDLVGTIDVALQVCAGLAKAHESGIVHRDIKPGNVIQTSDGHVKILDFGLAKLLDADSATTAASSSTLTQTQVGIVKGTPAYMSPEQIKGEAIDARSDLFSLGIMLFEMATGEVPFLRPSSTEMMHAIAYAKTPAIHSLRPNLPGDLQRIVLKCLEKAPADRYTNAKAMIEDLRTLRRKMESGQALPLSFKERIRDAYDRLSYRLRDSKPSGYVWLAGTALALAFALYLLTLQVGVGSLILLAVIGLLVYRHIRHQPRRVMDGFVRRVSRLPEVRFIACQDRRITVGVDRAAGQLYGRINKHLSACNRKLFFGEPLTMVIRSDLTTEETRQWLATPGVHYVRENAAEGD